MKQKKSIFTDIQQDIYNAKTYIEARDLILNQMEKCKITPYDKVKIQQNIRDIEETYGTEGKAPLNKLWSYITNSIFMFQGMGV